MFDVPVIEEASCLHCEYCGNELDAENAGEPCLDCANQLKRDADEAEYWKEVNRTAYVTSQYNNGREQ